MISHLECCNVLHSVSKDCEIWHSYAWSVQFFMINPFSVPPVPVALCRECGHGTSWAFCRGGLQAAIGVLQRPWLWYHVGVPQRWSPGYAWRSAGTVVMVPHELSAEVVIRLPLAFCWDSGHGTPWAFCRGGLQPTSGVLQGQWQWYPGEVLQRRSFGYHWRSAGTVGKLLWAICWDCGQAIVDILQRQSPSCRGGSSKTV